jgi:hypothetical protein
MSKLLFSILLLSVSTVSLCAMEDEMYMDEANYACPYYKYYELKNEAWKSYDNYAVPADSNCIKATVLVSNGSGYTVLCSSAQIKGMITSCPASDDRAYYTKKSCGYFKNPVSGVTQEFEYCKTDWKEPRTGGHDN